MSVKCKTCFGYCEEILRTIHTDENRYTTNYKCNQCGRFRSISRKIKRNSLTRTIIEDMTPDELLVNLDLIHQEMSHRGLAMLFG